MPEEQTIAKAHEDEREGKSPSTQAGEFVREEVRHVREGKHGARSTKQMIAIGLSKARRAGVKLPAPKKTKTSSRTRRQAQRDLQKGGGQKRKTSTKRSRAVKAALNREGHRAGSSNALSKQARSSARKRSRSSRSVAAKKAARTRNRYRGRGRNLR